MTYDLSGPWPGWVTWHNSPLFHGGQTFPSTGAPLPSIDAMVDAFVAGGVPVQAGGMRAVLAGVDDPDAVAVLGLDLVDYAASSWGDVYLATVNAPALGVPLWGVAGESTACNDYANGLAVYAAAPDGNVLRATGADHCDFESPTDAMCTGLCPDIEGAFSGDEAQATIRGLSTAFLLWQAGLDPDGALWWTPGGEPYDALLASGTVTVP